MTADASNWLVMRLIEFLFVVVFGLLGLLLIFVIADRFWCTEILGKIVPSRSVPIYNNRPWWMKRVALFIVVGVLESAFMLITVWLFMPYALDELVSPLGTLWVILLLAICISASFRNEEKPQCDFDNISNGSR